MIQGHGLLHQDSRFCKPRLDLQAGHSPSIPSPARTSARAGARVGGGAGAPRVGGKFRSRLSLVLGQHTGLKLSHGLIDSV